ncbi:MAG: Ger(x)C family spore germination protein [Bacillota bacterium]
MLRLNKIYLIKLIIIILFCLLLSGCWNRREVQELNVSTAIGIDYEEIEGKPQYTLSVLTMKSSQQNIIGGFGSSQSKAQTSRVVTAQGETVYDAIRNYSIRSSRMLFLGQTLVIVLGEETARKGITEIVDFLTRNKDMRFRSILAVCDGRAADALQAQPEFESMISTEIEQIISQNIHWASKAVGTDLLQVKQGLIIPGREVVVPYMKLFCPPEQGSPIRQGAAQGTTSENSQGPSLPNQKTFCIAGAGVFLGDRLIDWINEEETQGYVLIKNKARGGVIPTAYNDTRKNVSFVFRTAKAKIKPILDGDKLVFDVRIKGHGEMLEQDQAVIRDFSAELPNLEKLVNHEIERRCLNTVHKSQELKSDIFGFGDLLHRLQPDVWREIAHRWNEIYPTVTVNVTADFVVEHVGLTSVPLIVE